MGKQWAKHFQEWVKSGPVLSFFNGLRRNRRKKFFADRAFSARLPSGEAFSLPPMACSLWRASARFRHGPRPHVALSEKTDCIYCFPERQENIALSIRPLGALRDRPRTCRERRKAAVSATRNAPGWGIHSPGGDGGTAQIPVVHRRIANPCRPISLPPPRRSLSPNATVRRWICGFLGMRLRNEGRT